MECEGVAEEVPKRSFRSTVEGVGKGAKSGLPHGISASFITEERPPAAGTSRCTLSIPRHHHRARPGDDDEAARSFEGAFEGNACIGNHDQPLRRRGRKVGQERLGEFALLFTTAGAGHPGAQTPHARISEVPPRLSYEVSDYAGRALYTETLKIGPRTAQRKLFPRCISREKGGLGPAHVEANVHPEGATFHTRSPR